MVNRSILVIGNSTMDVLLNIPGTPSNGQTVFSYEKYSETPGGRGAYTAVAASRAGFEATLCTRIGSDANGEKLRRAFSESRINIGYVKTDKLEQTGLEVLMLEKYALAGRIVFPGANAKLNCGDIEEAFNSYPDFVISNLEPNEEAVIYAARFAKEKQIPFLADAVGAYWGFPLSKLEQVEILVAGEEETELLTGVRPDTIDNCLRASIAFSNMLEVKYVVLKLGDRGVYLYDGKYCDIIMAKDMPKVDDTAEHESFLAGIAAEYLREKNIFSAIDYGLTASALAASKVGAFSSIPEEVEVRSLLG